MFEFLDILKIGGLDSIKNGFGRLFVHRLRYLIQCQIEVIGNKAVHVIFNQAKM